MKTKIAHANANNLMTKKNCANMVNERKYLKKETPSQIYETKLQNNIVIVSSKSVTLIDPYNTTKQQNLTQKKNV